MTKALTIQPLHGGNDGHLKTLEDIREYVDRNWPLTKEDLVSWYSLNVKHGKGNRKGTSLTNSELYMNSLLKCGLLVETRGGVIECTFPRGKRRNRRVVEIIDEKIVYFLEMLRDARDGKTEKQLHKLAKKCGLTSDLKNGIQKRRGWLQSAQLLKRRDGKLYATPRGKKLIRKHFPELVDDARDDAKENPAEFGGKGEGPKHRTLKEYVYKVAEKVCGARVKERQMEYPLPSGDKVDVTAWDKGAIWHIEVKSRTSKDPDVTRGIYQCIKYAAVGKAVEKAKNSGRSVKSLLVVESKPSDNVSALAKGLGVRVYRLPASMRRELDERRAANG